MHNPLRTTALLLVVVWLTAERALAQGLGATRPDVVPVWGGPGPFWWTAQQQTLQAQRDAERRAALERDAEARRAALAEREAARVAAGGAATTAAGAANAAARTAAQHLQAARQAQTERAVAAYRAKAARRYAAARNQATLPTDLGAESYLGTVEEEPAAGVLRDPSSAEGTGEAVVEVRLPADAELWFDGYRTALGGAERSFTTPPLGKDQAYIYQVRARWTENGLPVEQTRQIRVRAGERTVVEFPGGAP